jgi:Alternative complex III, ActD subunit
MEAKGHSHREPRRAPTAILAEFENTHDVLHAAEKVRDAGYVRWDTHSPFPVHGMDRAMGLKDSRLGWIVILFALVGLSGAFVMMHWMNGVDYPTVVGDKPPGAPGTLPSMVPIMFELTILLSAFGAVLGMLHLNRLPRHNHPVFESERFRRATDDRFFISIEADDPKFDVDGTRKLLEGAHAANVEVIEEDES